MLLEARAELDEGKRKEIYSKMGRMLNEEGGVMVPMFNDFVDGFSTEDPRLGNQSIRTTNVLVCFCERHGKRKPDLCTPFLNWLPSVYRWASSCSSPPLRFSLA